MCQLNCKTQLHKIRPGWKGFCQFNKVICYAMLQHTYNSDVIQKVIITMNQLGFVEFGKSSECHDDREYMLDCTCVSNSERVNGFLNDIKRLYNIGP